MCCLLVAGVCFVSVNCCRLMFVFDEFVVCCW